MSDQIVGRPSGGAALGDAAVRAGSEARARRTELVRREAQAAGYLGGGKTGRISGRVTTELLRAAKQKSGLESDTELLEYALSKVALEDDYGARLLARRGKIADDVEL